MLIDQARAELTATLSEAGNHETKALGLLALNAGGVALLLSVHAVLNRFWPALLAGVGFSAACFAAALWSRAFRLGPSLDEFYADVVDRSPLDAAVAMLDALTAATQTNQVLNAVKKLCWVMGAAAIALTALAAAIYLPAVG